MNGSVCLPSSSREDDSSSALNWLAVASRVASEIVSAAMAPDTADRVAGAAVAEVPVELGALPATAPSSPLPAVSHTFAVLSEPLTNNAPSAPAI